MVLMYIIHASTQVEEKMMRFFESITIFIPSTWLKVKNGHQMAAKFSL